MKDGEKGIGKQHTFLFKSGPGRAFHSFVGTFIHLFWSLFKICCSLFEQMGLGRRARSVLADKIQLQRNNMVMTLLRDLSNRLRLG